MKRHRRNPKPTVIKYGSVSVKIYHGTRLKHGPRHPRFTGKRYPLHSLIWYDGRHMMRENFGKLSKARERASKLVELLSDGKQDVAKANRHDVVELLDGQKALAGSGVSVREACRIVADALKHLNGHSIPEAVRYFARMHPKELKPRLIAEVAAEMFTAKQKLGKSDTYVGQLRHQAGKFSRMFSKNIGDVSADDLKLFVDSLSELSPRTKNNCIAGVRELFSYARKQKYVPKDFDQLEGVEFFEDNAGAILIYSPDEMAELLKNADPAIVPALAIGAFAGLRRSEVMKLDWSEVNLRRGFITVAALKAKTKARRLVPVSKNLKAWLAPYAKTSGLFMQGITEDDYCAMRVATAKEAGFPWKRNALRHSFCSYRLAKTQDAAKVSLEAGNSPQMLFQHYRELVTPKDARRWFAIAPKRAANISVMPELALA